MSEAVVFLDRDGTLNVEKDYVYRYDDWEWISGVFEGLRKLVGLGFRLVVVSNQSGVARGYYTVSDVLALHSKVAADLQREGISVAGFYFCPHGPEEGCACRKPRPGLLLKAQRDLKIDFSRSYMIGDKLVDVEAAHAAGVQPILVGTGYGMNEKVSLPSSIPFVPNALAAAEWIARRGI